MSHAQAHREDQEQMEHDDSAQIQDEDIVEVVEDDGDEPMDEDDEDGEDATGNPNDKYDGEIVIGAPSNPEEEAMWREMNQDGDAQNSVDNSWGVSALHAADKSVFTVSLHPLFPNPPLAVSGGEDDLAYIFCPLPGGEASSSAGPAFEPVKLTGHTDSVSATGWSANGDMVATGGMDGRVRVWRRAPSQRTGDAAAKSAATTPAAEKTIDDYRRWEFLTSLETSSEVIWLTWHPRGNVLAAGCEDATVWMWSLPTGQTMAVLSSHTYPTTAGVFTESPGGILTTSEDSTLILWDPRTSQPVWKTSVFAHANVMELDPSVAGITALAVSPNGQLAAVGSANGLVKLVNVARGDVISRLEGHKEGDSVEALAFVDLLAGAGGGKGVVLVSGGTDGKGFVWDVATGRVRAELLHDESITSLAKHPAPTLHLVTTGSADRTLKTWDIRTGSLVAHHQGHMGVVNGVQVARAPPSASADGQGGQHGQVIVSAGDDGVSLIWRI